MEMSTVTARTAESETTIVIGGGQAGFAFSAKLRELRYPGRIILIGDEKHRPYQRPPLSKAYLLGETTIDRLQFRPERFYADNGIELRLSTRVLSVSRDHRTVTLSDGGTLSYDHLVFATGARPRLLPNEVGGGLPGVHYMRTLDDADRLAPVCRGGRKLLVVGGGYIGLEAAAVARKLGAHVTLIEAAPRILQRVASSETASYFRTLHRSYGVDVREGVGLAELTEAGGRIAEAKLTDGSTIPVDLAIVGIGVVPNQELATEAGLQCDNGIVVEAFCRTNDPRIMAVGDCASIPLDNALIRLESVGHAIEHAQTAASVLMGCDQSYRPNPWFWSDQFDVKLQIAGLLTGYDRVVARGGAPGPASHWYYSGDRLLAVDAMNDPRAYMIGKKLIQAGRSPDPAAVVDPAADLKALLAA
jgi:3-phenylpropionate/trans-cinnamate dioxygenase ferredoxin reductase subunit